MKIAAIVPTYRRPHDLERCLQALQKQTRLPDEVIVVVRDTDAETWAFLEAFNQAANSIIRTATVKITGVVAALNVGLDATQADIIAITDDDAAPHSDWLQRIETHYLADDRIAGVGGRDWVYHDTELEDGKREVVGLVQWFGRVIGEHHLGIGKAREVDILKGVNMSFRRSAIAGMRFDERMRGTGAQVHFEIAFSLSLRRSGWKLIYDPEIGVDHFRGKRFDEDQRDSFNQIALINAVHNETLVLLEHLSPLPRVVFLLWAILVGTRDAFGLVQWLRFVPKQGALAGDRLLASWQGRWQGWQTWRDYEAEAIAPNIVTTNN